jgi:hypothetical protein
MAECFLGGKRMKAILLIVLVFAQSAIYAQESLKFPIEPKMAKEWKYQSDQGDGGCF